MDKHTVKNEKDQAVVTSVARKNTEERKRDEKKKRGKKTA